MHSQFPLAHRDELLSSIIARYSHRLGLKDDKSFLEYLCGNLNIVPSALFQGHLKGILDPVRHVWPCTTELVAKNHTLLPLFTHFVPQARYIKLLNGLMFNNKNSFSLRSGVNASLLNFPVHYKVCKFCYENQKTTLGYVYVERLFQCPGVEVCPVHRVFLCNSGCLITSKHKYRFTSIRSDLKLNHLKEAISSFDQEKLCVLSSLIEELLTCRSIFLSFNQWSVFYQSLATSKNMRKGSRIDHLGIQSSLELFWGKEWLEKYGLNIEGNSNWLISLFRQHRKSFSYLQHFVVWLALGYKFDSLINVFEYVSQLPKEKASNFPYNRCNDKAKTLEKRTEWLTLTRFKSLKDIRDNKVGKSLYLWLYRYDNDWLMRNKPDLILNQVNKRVDWGKRDLSLVRRLLKLFYSIEFELIGPRRSKSWFARQLNIDALVSKKLDKLKCCKLFFIKYAESVDEYQTRRLALYLSSQISENKLIGCLSGIERAVGFSKKRIRKPARKILRLDLETWRRNQKLPLGSGVDKNR